jgi:predicted ATPase
MLKNERLLTFDIGLSKWTWDFGNISESTVVTTNILQLIEVRLKKMKPALLELLKVAVCLGNRFDRRILDKVWDNRNDMSRTIDPDKVSLDTLIGMAVEEAILETPSPDICRFAHDKVQESIVLLMTELEFKSLQAKVGEFLRQNLSSEELEELVFVVADLLNASERSSSIATDLNLRAARKAQSLSAFSSASRYIDYGIQALPKYNTWPDDYQLPLELYSIGAEVELSLGNVEKAVFYSRQVTNQKNVKALDKVRAYKIHAKKLYMGGSSDDALKVCLDILAQLGCTFSILRATQQLQAKIALDKTKRMLSKIDSLEMKGFISDPEVLELISLLEQGASTALQAKNKALYILQRCRCIQLIIEHGLSSHAASCFASFANIIMHEKGDWETGLKLAVLALGVQERLQSKYTETSTLFKTNQLVLGWALPLKSRHSSIIKGYKSGMVSGNIEGGCWCLMLAIWSQFYDGTPLKCVEEDCQVYIQKMEHLRQKNQASISRWHWQLVLNLIGDTANPNTSVISGTAIAEEEATSMTAKFNLYAVKCFACAHFGDYENGADIALKIGESHYLRLSGMAVWGFERFDRGIW